MEEVDKILEDAVKWWMSLSYNEQDRLLVKYIPYGEYYINLAKAGHLSRNFMFEMMQKEGVVL